MLKHRLIPLSMTQTVSGYCFSPTGSSYSTLLAADQKPKEVIHDDCLSHGGDELDIIHENLKNKAWKYLILLVSCLCP